MNDLQEKLKCAEDLLERCRRDWRRAGKYFEAEAEADYYAQEKVVADLKEQINEIA